MAVLIRVASSAAALFLLAAMAAPATASEAEATSVRSDIEAACAPLFQVPDAVGNALTSFTTVFGKPAIDWTDEDYAQVVNLAAACDGMAYNGHDRVDASWWRSTIAHARERNAELSVLNRTIREMSADLGADAIVLPNCSSVLDYAVDDYARTDNTRDLFGVDLMAMTDDDVERVATFVNYCLTLLPDYAYRNRMWRDGDIERTAGRLLDRALLVRQRREDWRATRRSASDVVVSVDGAEIPPTMLESGTRELVKRYNDTARQGRRFTPEMLAGMLNLIDEVERLDRSAWDRAYAEEVRGRLNAHIFDRRPH